MPDAVFKPMTKEKAVDTLMSDGWRLCERDYKAGERDGTRWKFTSSATKCVFYVYDDGTVRREEPNPVGAGRLPYGGWP